MNTLFLTVLAVGIVSLVVSLYVLYSLGPLNKLRKAFFRGSGESNLESILFGLENALQSLQREHGQLEQVVSQLQNHTQFAIQKVGMVRFNPFDDGGGNFSFSLALLNHHNAGVVITSMHGRQQNRIYSKSIISGKSETPLTEEEQRAVLEANEKFQIINSK